MNTEQIETECADREFTVTFGLTGPHKAQHGRYFCRVEALLGTRHLCTSYADEVQVAKLTAMRNALTGY